MKPTSFNSLKHLALLAASLLLPLVPLQANPVGGQVTVGNVTITEVPGGMTITQGDQRAIIHWQDFSIGAGELTQFIHPNSTAATLNRVVGGIPSNILGTLSANGHVFLVNPNGILVGPTGVINTAGFVASTLDVPDPEFLAGGDMNFGGPSLAGVVNLGSITASEGDVILMARTVENAGVINAPNGVAALAAGNDILMQAAGDERVVVRSGIPGGGTGTLNSGTINAAQAELKAAGGNVYALAVNNTGIVKATGIATKNGRVILSSGGGVVQNDGQLIAKNVDGSGGVVKLDGGPGGSAINNGTIDAAASDASKPGGTVEMLGDFITLGPTSVINVSGSDGGLVSIGVSAQTAQLATGEEAVADGATPPPATTTATTASVTMSPGATITSSGASTTTAAAATALPGGIATYAAASGAQAAKQTTIQANSLILANATNTGKGGNVIIWANEQATIGGTIEAKGGTLGGDGGFIETSARKNLVITDSTSVNASAPKGKSGLWLLDPDYDFFIVAGAGTSNNSGPTGFTPTGNNSSVGADLIVTQLNAGTDVTITTSGVGGAQAGDIFVNSAVAATGAATFTLNAARHININSTIGAAGSNVDLVMNTTAGNITFATGSSVDVKSVDATAVGNLTVNAPVIASGEVKLKAQGGNVLVVNGSANDVQSTAGKVTLNGDNGVTLGASGGSKGTVHGATGVDVISFSGGLTLFQDSSIIADGAGEIAAVMSGPVTLDKGTSPTGPLIGTNGGRITLTGTDFSSNTGFVGVSGLRTTLGGTSGQIDLAFDTFDNQGPIRSGASSLITLQQNSARDIDLGTETPGRLSVTQTELDNMTGLGVSLGSTVINGHVIVSAPITSTLPNLNLWSVDNVQVNAALNLGTGGFFAQAGGSITGNGGITADNINLNAGTGPITLNGPLVVDELVMNSGGSIGLNSLSNQINRIGDVNRGGGITVRNTLPLIIDGIWGGANTANTVIVRTVGNITLNAAAGFGHSGAQINVDGAGNEILLEAAGANGRFVNNAGATALNPTGGARFRAYSIDQNAPFSTGGLTGALFTTASVTFDESQPNSPTVDPLAGQNVFYFTNGVGGGTTGGGTTSGGTSTGGTTTIGGNSRLETSLALAAQTPSTTPPTTAAPTGSGFKKKSVIIGGNSDLLKTQAQLDRERAAVIAANEALAKQAALEAANTPPPKEPEPVVPKTTNDFVMDIIDKIDGNSNSGGWGDGSLDTWKAKIAESKKSGGKSPGTFSDKDFFIAKLNEISEGVPPEILQTPEAQKIAEHFAFIQDTIPWGNAVIAANKAKLAEIQKVNAEVKQGLVKEVGVIYSQLKLGAPMGLDAQISLFLNNTNMFVDAAKRMNISVSSVLSLRDDLVILQEKQKKLDAIATQAQREITQWEKSIADAQRASDNWRDRMAQLVGSKTQPVQQPTTTTTTINSSTVIQIDGVFFSVDKNGNRTPMLQK